ncbi:hypothetical protein ACFFRR_004806 [Megaselia abdita]
MSNSVNGDTCVVRNGRSTSKISIYDYPEHLNPFYEDENHKRLRFWKVGKNKNSESRRSSFSLDGLRDIWTFKSFRLKKKSSTLGVNKTSESPPCLRRDISPTNQHYGTYDPKLRHTTNGFDRNVPYRSSLQDMRTPHTIDRMGFNRNDRYRSTVQTQNPATGSGSLSRRSSQSSVYSTNPFDEDDDNDVIVVPGTGKRPHRKKRRAPPPPSQVNQIKEESPSSEILEISNLTAQIESFVNATNEDEDVKKPVAKKLPTPPPQIIVEEYKEPVIETEEKLVIVEEPRGGVVVEVENKDEKIEENIVSEKERVEKSTNVVTEVVVVHQKSNGAIPKVERLEERRESPEKEELPVVSPPRRKEKKVEEQIIKSVTEQKVLNTDVLITEAKIEVPDTPQAQRKFVKEPSLTPSDDTNISIDLRICESKDDLTSDASDVSNCKVAYSPLKDSSPEPDNELPSRKPEIPVKPINLENSSSRYHSDDNLNGSIYRKPSLKFKNLTTRSGSIENGPPTQRRSVKDIIESINKSQSLLKMNQAEPQPTTDYNANQAFKTLEEREKEIKRMLEELDKPLNTNSNPNKDLDDLVDSLNNNISNNDVFQKCVVKKTDIRHTREQSPTVSNLDWNPIPKPKRSKNFN